MSVACLAATLAMASMAQPVRLATSLRFEGRPTATDTAISSVDRTPVAIDSSIDGSLKLTDADSIQSVGKSGHRKFASPRNDENWPWKDSTATRTTRIDWRSAAIRPDGGLVALGDVFTPVAGTSSPSNLSHFLIASYTASGELDPSFGLGGFLLLPFETDGRAWHENLAALDVQADGQLVIAGQTLVAGKQKLFVRRLARNGRIDASFGNAGTVLLEGRGAVEMMGLAFLKAQVKSLPSGDIVMAANTAMDGDLSVVVYRLDARGRRVATFGRNGLQTSITEGFSLARLVAGASGGIYIAGQDRDRSCVAEQLTEAGAPVKSFGTDGRLVYRPESSRRCAFGDLLEAADGSLLLAGTASFDGEPADRQGDYYFVKRFTADGAVPVGDTRSPQFESIASRFVGQASVDRSMAVKDERTIGVFFDCPPETGHESACAGQARMLLLE